METSIRTKTFFQKRNTFSEAHYQLPNGYGMFDIDMVKGEWLNIDIESTKEEATYIEYRKLIHDKSQSKFDIERFKPVALFELKFKRSDYVVKQFTEFKEGTSAWAELMFCKITNMRFFLVMADNGKPPYKFVEFDMDGKPISINELNFNNTNVKEMINHFWVNIIKI